MSLYVGVCPGTRKLYCVDGLTWQCTTVLWPSAVCGGRYRHESWSDPPPVSRVSVPQSSHGDGHIARSVQTVRRNLNEGE